MKGMRELGVRQIRKGAAPSIHAVIKIGRIGQEPVGDFLGQDGQKLGAEIKDAAIAGVEGATAAVGIFADKEVLENGLVIARFVDVDAGDGDFGFTSKEAV